MARAGEHVPARRSPRPALAVTYNGDDPGLLSRLVSLVDVIEISPDSIACSIDRKVRIRPEVVEELVGVADRVRFTAHGVGLSIGSYEGWQEGYLGLVDELTAHVELDWHSEHLAYSVVAGEEVGTMLPLPRSGEVVDLVCDRVKVLQDRYSMPFLLEHVVNLLPDPPGEF